METNIKKKLIIGAGMGILLLGAVFFLTNRKSEKPSIQPKSTPRFTFEKGGELQINYPSQLLDLSSWKLTLPVSSLSNSESPRDIFPPEIETFDMRPWFMLTSDKKGVVFRAPVNAPTTANSGYPRSELRELAKNGNGKPKEAFWSSLSGTHTFFLDEAITAVPKNKPEVVAGQIHGDDDDLITIRLEGQKLFVARGSKNLATLDEEYVLGKRFTVKFAVKNGEIAVFFNNIAEPVYVLSKEVNQAYFKAGVYTQSNCETEGSPDFCNEENYGEVVIYQLTLSHN